MKSNYSRLQNILRARRMDALLVSAPENVFYVSDVPTSFTASNRLLFCSRRNSPLMCIVPAEGEPSLVLSAAALDVVSRHTWIKDLRMYATGTYILRKEAPELSGETFPDALQKILTEKLGSKSGKRLGIEENDLSAGNFRNLKEWFSESAIVDGAGAMMESRMIKNSEEIRRFRNATTILCRVMKKIEKACEDRPTESELDEVLKSEMMKQGAESWQQTTIAAGRLGGADIYNQPNPKRRLASGDLIRLDVGCVYEGYTADLSRTYAVEKVPERAKKVYGVLKTAYEEFLDKLKPGTPASEVNVGIVDYVREKLDKKYYRGNVGHGVGVELYDRPLLSKDDSTPLQSGMTLSYEVPYHITGFGGLNLEDSVLIKGKGSEVVSHYDRDLIVV